jgi:cell division septation protein DedD
VQLGSFGAEDNARALARRADQFGYRASVSTTRASGRTLYRVRVGPYAGRREAEAAASALGAHGLKGQVVAAD